MSCRLRHTWVGSRKGGFAVPPTVRGLFSVRRAKACSTGQLDWAEEFPAQSRSQRRYVPVAVGGEDASEASVLIREHSRKLFGFLRKTR
jgi:hypothetical protein